MSKEKLSATYSIPALPLSVDVETKRILKQLAKSRAAIAELKGVSATIPNVSILINSLVLQEAKDSSEVENIVTTHDELYKAELHFVKYQTIAAKEVQRYAKALMTGYELVKKEKIINHASIKKIQGTLENNQAGYRKVSGTKLENDKTKEIIYVPPQNVDEIKKHMDVLLNYMNEDELDSVDPLIKMAILHHQFESIHPFYDGNGRTGRILNILYLILKDLLNIPTLYLSRYINQNKNEYYRLLQSVRENGEWEEWILYMLVGCEKVAQQSVYLIKEIKIVMQRMKHHIRSNYKFYSQDLLNNLFRHPYTKIEFLEKELQVERRTAGKYLNELAQDEFLNIEKLKIGNSNYYMNNDLIQLLIHHQELYDGHSKN